jgi:hypothetical protein
MDAENKYFWWLRYYGGVNLDPKNQYNLLLKRLFARPFMVKLSNDANRSYEALELRREYITYELPAGDKLAFNNINRFKKTSTVSEIDTVSFLELLISLAIRGDDMTEDVEKDTFFWFWNMIGSMGLAIMTDEIYELRGGDRYVDTILEKVNMRTYSRTGIGGLFPLPSSKVDQRKIELWYQMCALIEHEGW